MDTMCASATTEKCVRPMLAVLRKNIFEHWLKNVPPLMFGEHQLILDISDPDEFFIEKAKEELRETPEIVAQGYKELREMIAGEPDLYVPDDEDFYQMYLRPCKWYAKSAFRLMKRYYRFEQNHPRIFPRSFLPTKEKNGIYAGLVYPLPIRAKDGSRILIVEAGKRWKPKEVPLDDCFKAIIKILYMGMLEPKTQIAGTRIIIDVDSLSLHQVSYLTPSFAKMITDFIQKCAPMRIKSIHVVNQSFLFNMAYAFFKPFIEEKVRNRIHFHGKNWETLMTIINKEALLKRHGGEVETAEELYGTLLWQATLSFEPLYKANYGYKKDKSKE